MEHNRLDSNPVGTDTTQVFGTPDAGMERTAAIEPTASEATRMGTGIVCAVCGTANSGLETYCSECGFLLSSTPGSIGEEDAPVSSAFVLVEDRTGRSFPLRDGPNTVGRESSDVLLMEPTVSRRHARIIVSGSSVEVMDVGSTNGTQVDGMPIVAQTSRPASPGSVIRFGNATFTLRSTAPGGPGSAEPHDSPGGRGSAEPPLPTSGIAAWLRGVAQEGNAPADIAIPHGTLTVGRRAGNDHIIAGDPFVSGRHARFHADGETVTVTDLFSTNGTMVNGKRLTPSEPMTLQEGDEISIGQGRYLFESVGDTDVPSPQADDDADDPASVPSDASSSALAPDGDEPRGSAL